MYEITWDFDFRNETIERFLPLAAVEPVYAYAPYGDGIALPYVNAIDYYFAVAFINSDDNFEAAPVTYTIVVYYSQLGLPSNERALTMRQAKVADAPVTFIKMIGGKDFDMTPLIKFFLTSHFIIYRKPASGLGSDDDYGLYVPHPDITKPPHNLFTLYHKHMRVVCTNYTVS